MPDIDPDALECFRAWLPPLSPAMQSIRYLHLPSVPTSKFHTLHIITVNTPAAPTSNPAPTLTPELSPAPTGAPMTLTRFTQCTAAKTPNDTDHWLFAVIDKANGLALSIDVITPFRNGALPEGVRDDLNFRVLVMGLHHPFAATKDRVLYAHHVTADCKLVPTCADVLVNSADAEKVFFTAHFDKQWAAGAREPSQHKSFWDAMEREFHERCAQLQQLRAEDGDLKWQRCTHCDGQGVIDHATKAADLPVTAASNHEAFGDDDHVARHLAEGLPPGWTRTPSGALYYHDGTVAASATARVTPATPQPTPSQPRSWADAAVDMIQTLTAERDRAVARVKFLEAKCDEAQAVLGRAQRSEP